MDTTLIDKQPIRIALAGASGVGKTTTAMALKEKLSVPYCPIGSRSVTQEMGFDSPYDVDAFGKRREFQHELFAQKVWWESINDEFITDRTHLDNLVYSIMHDCIRTVDVNFMNSLINSTKENYTHVVFFPVESFISVDNDPQRVHNLDYHRVYENLLKTFLDLHCPGYLEIKEPSIEGRVKEIFEWVK